MITRQEIDIIKTEIINELEINSKLIDDLTPVTSLLDDDLFEIHGGRCISFGAIRNSLGALEASMPDLSNYATHDWVENQGYLKASALCNYATRSWVNEQGFLKESALSGYATQNWVTGQGFLTASALTDYATQQFVENNYLSKVDFEKLFYPVYKDDGSIAYIRTPYTLLSDGDVQSKLFSDVGGNGGSASAIELLTQWTDYTIADKDWLGLSAGLGVELHNRLTLLEGQVAGGLSVDLTGYATQDWVNNQGFVKASDLTGYATQQWVNNQGFVKASDLTGYATQQWVNNQGFLKAVAWGDVSGKPSWIGATKPSYDFSEIGSKPTTLAGYGITDAYTKTEADGRFLGINATAKAAEKLATTSIYTAWGQTFFENGVPKSISGDMTNVGNITASGGTYKFLTYPTSLYGLVLSMNSSGCVLMQSQRAANDSEVFPIALNPLGGKVGVKTTSPQYDLDVNGVARVSELKLGKFTFTDKGDYVEFDGTILALGDVQSKKYANIAGGGTGDGGDFSIMSSWNAELANDPDYVLSAGLGYNLHITKLDKIEAEGLYQPKGNYLTSHQSLADYVTINTAQTISGLKTLGLKEGDPQNHEVNRLAITPYGHTGGPWYINSLDNPSTAYLRIKYGTSVPLSLSHTGELTVSGKIIKSGGTSSQFLKADGSVDSNTYLVASNFNSSVLSCFGWAQRGTSFTWGNQTGTALSVFNDSTGGSIGFRRDNPVVGQMSAIIDGYWYQQEGQYRCLDTSDITNTLPNTFVKKSGDTMTGVLKVNEIQEVAGNGVIAYHPAGWTGVANTQWGVGTVNSQGVIRSSNNSLIHYRHDVGNATIWDSGNDGAGSGLDADLLDGYHADAFVNRTAYDGADNLSILKANYSALADSKAHTVKLQHGSHSMAFGWLLGGYAIENAYGGWFISDYGTPRWIGADNGTWKSETFAFISSNVASATKLQTTRTIWGQNFNGEGNVNGHLSIGKILGQQTAGRAELSLISEGDYPIDLMLGRSGIKKWSITSRASGESDYFGIYNYTNAAFRFCILENGYIGIGTTSPAYKLDVNGSFRTYNGNVLLATSSGRVGIGTTSPAYKLDVNGSFRTYNGNVLLATSSGRVGIGTTSPSGDVMLDVNGHSIIRGDIFVYGSSYGNFAMFRGLSAGEAMRIEPYNASNAWLTNGITMDQSGNVIIGGTGTTDCKLDVRGSLRIGNIVLRDAGDYLEINKTVLSLGDVQSKKASDMSGDSMVSLYVTGSGKTLKIPVWASAVFIRSLLDGDAYTIEIDGDPSEIECLPIYVYEQSPGDGTIKWKNPDGTYLSNYQYYGSGLFMLVNMGAGKLKLVKIVSGNY